MSAANSRVPVQRHAEPTKDIDQPTRLKAFIKFGLAFAAKQRPLAPAGSRRSGAEDSTTATAGAARHGDMHARAIKTDRLETLLREMRQKRYR